MVDLQYALHVIIGIIFFAPQTQVVSETELKKLQTGYIGT